MPAQNLLVYLADLTHMGPVLSSNVQPLAIGLVGAKLLTSFPDDVELELFKYPTDLSAALSRRMPRIMGFSHYSWNADLSYEYARMIKRHSPDTIIVFGGPNYELRDVEMGDYWQRHPLIDFYVVKEGELAMVELVRTLREYNYDVDALKADGVVPPNCHYTYNGRLRQGEILPRVKDLAELPSPYLMGLMDKFFDDVLSPMIHTTRGCPFACTFCSEGAAYYNKVAQRIDFTQEIEYIAQRRGKIQDLFLTDANFGMFKQDVAKAETIARIQQEFGWPKRLVVATGKNQKERVISVSKILNGALNVAASLQSTNLEVLDNVKRSNLSIDALQEMARQTTEVDSDTYTEIILGLPGDTKERHTHTLRDVVDADLGIVRMFQLIMLAQTELNSIETRAQHGLQTRHRIMPRSFGRYDVLGETLSAVESEEICVGSNTLSFDEYVECRELDLSVEILHNGRVFAELQGLCKFLGVSWFVFLRRCFNRRRTFQPELRDLYDTFRRETTGKLFQSRDELADFVRNHMDELIGVDGSTNEMANGKSRAIFRLQQALHELLFDEMQHLMAESDVVDQNLELYLDELKTFSLYRKIDLINCDKRFDTTLHFDFPAIKDHRYAVDPMRYRFNSPVEFTFQHSDAQRKYIEGYVSQYGTSLDGLGRILMRVWPTERLFREVKVAEASRTTFTPALSLETV